MAGNVNYMPTSGGLPTPGYKMIIGFDYYAWLGMKSTIKELLLVNRHQLIITIYLFFKDRQLKVGVYIPAQLKTITRHLEDLII